MCKAKTCKWYKVCLAKRDLIGDTRCNDYEKNTQVVKKVTIKKVR